MNLCEGRDRLRGVRVAPDLERNGESLLEERDRLVRIPEQEGQPTERGQELARVRPVLDLLVQGLGLLRIGTGGHPLPPPLRDERAEEVRVGGCPRVVERLCELERPLDVLPGRLPVALPSIAAGPPPEDARPQTIARDPGSLGEVERLGEERERRRDRGEAVAATAEPEEDFGAIHVGEHGAVGDLAGPSEQRQRLLHLADVHPRPGLREEHPQLELRRRLGRQRALGLGKQPDRLGVVVRLNRCLGARDCGLEACTLVPVDPGA